jgi:hypothetical protein
MASAESSPATNWYATDVRRHLGHAAAFAIGKDTA